MLQQGHLVAAPALCRKQHGVAVGTQITGVCNKDLVHDVVQVCVIIEKNENALESLFCTVYSTWMKEEQYGKVSSRNARGFVWKIYHWLKCTRSSS